MAEGKELVYWSVWAEQEAQAKVLAKTFERYEKSHPGITIKAIWNGRDNLVKLRSYLAGGKTIDLFDGDAEPFLGLVLNENLAADVGDVAKDLSGVMLPHTVDLFHFKGKQYAIPYIHNSVMFFYNKSAFKKAGIKSRPETWSAFIDTCRKLKQADFEVLAVEGNVDFYQFYYASYLLDRLGGSDFVMDLATDKTGEKWKSPLVAKMLQLEKELWDNGCIPEDSKGYQWPAAQNNLALGDTAMELVGSWLPLELRDAVEEDFEWGAFGFPTVPGGTDSNNLILVYMVMGVYAKSANIAEAKSVLKFLLSPENQKLMADEAHVGVPRKGIQWDQGISDVVQIVNGSSGGFIGDGVSMFYPDYASQVMKPLHGKYLMKAITADQFVERIAAETRKYWKGK